jgi:REP element-mobilizing transposase RayT
VVLNDFGKIADECWRAIPEHFLNVELGAHMIMPNHVHGVIVIRADDESASTVVVAQHVGAQHIVPLWDCCAPTMTTTTPTKSTSNLVHWERLSVRTNPPYRIESTRNTTPQSSGSVIIMKESSATSPSQPPPNTTNPQSYLGEVPDRAVGVAIHRSQPRPMEY